MHWEMGSSPDEVLTATRHESVQVIQNAWVERASAWVLDVDRRNAGRLDQHLLIANETAETMTEMSQIESVELQAVFPKRVKVLFPHQVHEVAEYLVGSFWGCGGGREGVPACLAPLKDGRTRCRIGSAWGYGGGREGVPACLVPLKDG
jgi:hypothetical protein